MLVQQNTLALLHTFESTARHLSFTRAAEEMNLTQGAISHRIRHLEGLLGFRLFIRLTRKLALTEEGGATAGNPEPLPAPDQRGD